MIQQMINNLLGKYSEFIKFQQDGTVKVFIPEDINKWIKLALVIIKK